jgi:hypothetical protein
VAKLRCGLFLAFASILRVFTTSLPAQIPNLEVNPPNLHSGVYVTSRFVSLRDGTVQVNCLTSTIDPSTNESSIDPYTQVQTAMEYQYFSTQCEVQDDSTGAIVVLPDGNNASSQVRCTAPPSEQTSSPSGNSDADQGFGDASNLSGLCQFTFTPMTLPSECVPISQLVQRDIHPVVVVVVV